jgi:hypothetical protein
VINRLALPGLTGRALGRTCLRLNYGLLLVALNLGLLDREPLPSRQALSLPS